MPAEAQARRGLAHKTGIAPQVRYCFEHGRLFMHDRRDLSLYEGNRDLWELLEALSATQSPAQALERLGRGRNGQDPALAARFQQTLALLAQMGLVELADLPAPQPAGEAAKAGAAPRPAGRRAYSYDAFIARISDMVRPAGSQPLARPLLVEWQLTNACNLSCFYCYHGENKARTAGQLSTPQALSLARDLARSGVMQVTLEGGEPLLHPGLLDIVAELKNLGLQVRILTNGTRLSPDMASALAGLLDPRADLIQISLDGSSAAVHELSRGEGSFEPALRGLANLARAGLPCQVSMVAHQSNLHDLKNTYLLAGRFNNVTGFMAAHYMKAGSALAMAALDKAPLLEAFHQARAAAWRDASLPPATLLPGHLLHLDEVWRMCQELSNPEIRYCRAGRAKVTIDANGDVYPCHFLIYPEFKLGSLRQESLADIWTSPRMAFIRDPRSPQAECHRCDRGRWCGKKCMGLAYAYYRDLDRADPNCLYAARGFQAASRAGA
ncbi:hypothetical protein AAU61_15795 [Desulfocarbo indianensis]|nr:hypothetical protein AAU61_15795 [Desulfocarbo indianensis]